VDLVIAEKPSVARDLARVLGVPRRGDWFENEQYAITWCIGHLVELEEPAAYDAAWKPWRLEVLPMLPAEFKLTPAKHAKAQLRTVAKLLRERQFAGVINACDAGREGELIFRYVYQYARSKLPVRRLWISSLTDDAIRRGFSGLRPGRELEPLADAARSRSEADWLVGMNATRALTVRNRNGREGALLSIGRVQTPTLALIVAREQEIRVFVPRPYWEVRAEFRSEAGTFTALWRHDKRPRLASAELAGEIVQRDTAAGDARVVSVRAKTVREPPPQLFDLTSLQRTANRRFGWSASRTLELAQALYEQHKMITYPRTDSRHLSADVAQELPALFQALTGIPEYAGFAQHLVDQPPRPNRRIVDDAKVSDHHAIIPTGARRALDRDEARLFDLIARRFLGAFYPDAEIAVTEAWIRVGAGQGAAPGFEAADREHFIEALPPPPDHYLARGRVRVVAGWQEVAGIEDRRRDDHGDHDRDDAPLPPLAEGQPLAGAYRADAKQTTPPPRYTEASLLAAMESAGKQIDDEALREAMKDLGLGTPATRAAIIETLLRREFIERRATGSDRTEPRKARGGSPSSGRAHLVPTQTGIDLIDALAAAKVSTLASAELTGRWEARLTQIARGEDTREAFMADIARYVTSVIDALRGTRASAPPDPPPSAARPSPPAPPSTSRPRPVRVEEAAVNVAEIPPSLLEAVRDALRDQPAPRAPSMSSGPRANGPIAVAPANARAKKPKRSKAKPKRSADPRLVCPRCRQGALIAGHRGWGCDRWREGCRFVIWFETAGRRLTETQLRALITTGKTRKAKFSDARGKPFDARLVLDPTSATGVQLERL
jgi:DNA topoisomerase-3